MSVSAAIIAKNEEALIERCIGICSEWADEIVVVDTGSTDRTKEILSKDDRVTLYESEHFNAETRVADFRFNVARNESIAKCTKDWVVWWDVDDTTDAKSAMKIRTLGYDAAPHLHYFKISAGGQEWLIGRMFRKDSGTRFDPDHSCHEVLTGGAYIRADHPDIVVTHKPVKGRDKNKRNLMILETDYYDRGHRYPRTMFYLANEYRDNRMYERAIKMYERYLEVAWWKEERYFAHYYIALIHSMSRRFDEAIKWLHLSLSVDYRFAESYCLLGDILATRGESDMAISCYRMALSMSPPDTAPWVLLSAYGSYPRSKLAEFGYDA